MPGNPAPDFVIAGAPKCGTSALYTYLASCPGVAMASRKEPYYWCPDIKGLDAPPDAAGYEALWRHARPGDLKGEATPAYLRSQVAAAAILAARPDAKFIVILRSPAVMAASFHAQMLVSGLEDVKDFEKAWRLQAARRQGRHIPPGCRFAPNLQYAQVCALGDQVERLAAVIPAGQLHIVLLDDLHTDPRRAYLDILRFLGVPDDGRTAFAPVNPNRRRRGAGMWLGLARGRWNPIRLAARALRLRRLYDRFFLKETPRPAMDPAFNRELHDAFRPQVETLERIMGRDLSRWKTAPGG